MGSRTRNRILTIATLLLVTACNPTMKIVVEGNTDERGGRGHHFAFGQRRADAVKRYLALLGAGDRQIGMVSFGKEKPRCTLSDESRWAQNRRPDLVRPGDYG
jgi:peptidoglycan-associated lipoprotein